MIGFGMVFGFLFLVLIIGGAILLAFWLAKALFPAGQKTSGIQKDHELTPREILDQRYALGEIAQDQYESIKLDLAN